jgi:hypothetical protein
MDKMCEFAIANPLARATEAFDDRFQRVTWPWSIILTVNK